MDYKLINEIRQSIRNKNILEFKALINSNKDILWIINGDSELIYDFFRQISEDGLVDYAAFLESFKPNLNKVINRECLLSFAATKGQLEMARWLISKGANVNRPEGAALTPLHAAVTMGMTELSQTLIEHNADINAIHTRLNQTPLDLARIWGHSKIETMLLSFGAKATESKIDFSSEFGSPILSYIHTTAGKVLPISYNAIIGATDVTQRIAIVNKGKNKLLFTVGIFQYHTPMIELLIVLQDEWNMMNKDSSNQFPLLLLQSLSNKITCGLSIDESYFISSSDKDLSSLSWPEDIDGFYPVDFNWSKASEDSMPREEHVILLTLLPIKKKKNGKVKPADIELNRKANWGKFALNLNPPSDCPQAKTA